MNHFHPSHGGVQEADAADEAPRSPFADLAGRFANWMTGADRLPLDEPSPVQEPVRGDRGEAFASSGSDESNESTRFPLAPFGYNRAAVDEHLAQLERELEALQAKHRPTASITDELERVGEQTASILVVAHDQAHETTRLAQEQAERCVADAAANAVAITAEAKEKLRALDAETDAIWRERERLLEDVRVVSTALASLADQASERFPAAEPPAPGTGTFEAVAAPAHAFWEQPEDVDAMQDGPPAEEPQATEAFDALEDEGTGVGPGDTGSWLVGLEPPDLRDD